MRKIKLISLSTLLLLILSGCGHSILNSAPITGGVPDLDGFVTIKSTYIQGDNQVLSKEYIIYDKETKVEYMIISTGDSKITMTPLYEADGKPKLYNK